MVNGLVTRRKTSLFRKFSNDIKYTLKDVLKIVVGRVRIEPIETSTSIKFIIYYYEGNSQRHITLSDAEITTS